MIVGSVEPGMIVYISGEQASFDTFIDDGEFLSRRIAGYKGDITNCLSIIISVVPAPNDYYFAFVLSLEGQHGWVVGCKKEDIDVDLRDGALCHIINTENDVVDVDSVGGSTKKAGNT